MRSLQKVVLYLLLVIAQDGRIGVAGDEEGNAKFGYFLKSNPDKAMTLEEISSLPNPPKNLFVYVHGWNGENLEDTGAVDFKDFVLKETQDYDAVMTVDWTPNTDWNYPGVEKNVAPIVGEKLAEELKKVKDMAHIPPSEITMTAHSLGNKVIGDAGRQLKSSKVGLIKKMIVLDTPDADFARKGDAGEVIGIHTSWPIGTSKKIGDVDYFFMKYDHPALWGCFSDACKHRAAKDIGKQYLSGELDRYLEALRSGDPTGGLKKSLANFKKNQPITIFVLDYSKSMEDYGRIDNLIASTKSRLGSFPLHQEVAMVVFGGSASVIFGPTNVTNESMRKRLVDSVPGRGQTLWGTSIGAGLRAAIGIIPKGRCAAIVLTTDGEENTKPYAHEVESEIPRCTSISGLAAGPDASKILEALAERHGGKVVSIADNTGGEKFTDGLQSIEEAQMPPWLRTIDYPAKQLSIGSKNTVDFLVDSGMKEMHFKYPPVHKGVEVTVTPPNGDISGCRRGDTTISCANGTPGKYTVKAIRKTVEQGRKKRETKNEEEIVEKISIRLSASPDITATTLPALLQGGLSNATVEPRNSQLTIIYGELKSELYPVLGAALEAYLTSPQGDTKRIKLYDDGVGADETRGDGIYSRYISTPLVVGQRYEVVVRASCVQEGTCKVKDFDGKEKQAEPFEREVIAGSIRALTEYKEPPPAAVSDLTVLSYEKEERLVTLRWTAVGANADSDDVAAGVEIGWASNCNSSCQWEDVDESSYQTKKLDGTPREFQQVKLAIPEQMSGEMGEKCVYFNVIYHNNQTSAQDSNVVSTCDWKPEVDDGIDTLTIVLIAVVVAILATVCIGFIRSKKLYK